MKFLILNTDYAEFVSWLYTGHLGLERRPYEEQMRVRNESLFGWGDFYPRNLRTLGHEARNIYVNNEFMQKAWAQEHRVTVEEARPLDPRVRGTVQRARRAGYKTPLRLLRPLFLPLLKWLGSPQAWVWDILAAQIRHYKPDILLNLHLHLSTDFLREVRPYTRLLVGQHASPLTQTQDYGVYDLMISSLPNFVDYFRLHGVASEYLPLGFEPAVLQRVGEPNQARGVSFVGSLFQVHGSRREWLEYVCERVPVRVWGHGFDDLPHNSAIFDCFKGTAWGVEMYRVLRDSLITLNHHIDVAGPYANNMRLYEATGLGTLLITDWKENLHEMFDPGREVVAYKSAQECVELTEYYLTHADEREAIARAGQQRTLSQHTYYQRMQELVDIVRKHLTPEPAM